MSMKIQNGTFTGRFDEKNNLLCCGDSFLDKRNNVSWKIEYSVERAGFVARSGSMTEPLNKFQSKYTKKIQA